MEERVVVFTSNLLYLSLDWVFVRAVIFAIPYRATMVAQDPVKSLASSE
jgi:hypothetical protein